MNAFARRYQESLHKWLQSAPKKGTGPTPGLVRAATTLGLDCLELARIHERAMLVLTPVASPAGHERILRQRSGSFFLKVLGPVSTDNRRTRLEIAHRKAAALALLRSKKQHRNLLRQSRATEQRTRHLAHHILSVQEEEKKAISRELHDQIAQMLAGINVHLASLETTASFGRTGMALRIRNTQRLVEKSVKVIHRFARELRPPVLDDLGLIPAFHDCLRTFTKQTGIRVDFTVFSGVEDLPGDKRTVLYRVAQAALSNISRHADATRVIIKIAATEGAVGMSIRDNGKAFDVERILSARRNRRLGLIGMRERVEMVGGKFGVTSAVGEGTTINVQIPFKSHKA